MSQTNLQESDKIVLFRVKNGWVACDSMRTLSHEGFHCFQSTKELQKALPELIGESGWKIEIPRDDKGRFLKP